MSDGSAHAPSGLSPRPLADLVRHVVPLRETDRLWEAATRIAEQGTGLPVAESDGHLIGFLSLRDITGALFPAYLDELRHTEFLTKDFESLLRGAAEAATLRVAEVMNPEPATVKATDSETHAAELFLHQDPNALAVVDEQGHIAGVVRLSDVIESLITACGVASDD